VKPGELRMSALLRLSVVDAEGARMSVLDVRTSQPTPPDAPRLVGLLCSPHPVIASLGLKRHDIAASLGRARAHTHGRFVPWHEINSINTHAIQLRCRFSELTPLAEAPDPGPPVTASEQQ
jgi:hypothetical protein